MKRFNMMVIFSFLMLFVFSLLPLSLFAQGKVITLNYAHFMPIVTKQAQLAEQWSREVEKRTSGRVKIIFFPGGTLSPAPLIYDNVVKGIADIGWSYFALTRGKFPLTEVIDLPLGYKSGYVATKLVNDYYKKFKPKELDETKIMYLHAHGPGILITKRPVNKLEDLKGMKIRSTGLSSKIVSNLGAAPVGMPISESYDSLMKGVVDGILLPVEGLKQWKIAEVTKYVTENYGSAYSVAFFCVMNKSKWNSLPPDIQKIIEKINEEWIEKTGKLWDEIDREGREFGKAKGIQFIKLPAVEEERWNAKVRPLFDDYVKQMKARGLPGDQALKFAVDYLQKNQK